MRRLWCHGKVDSMARPTRRCEAIGVENETIVFLGTDQEALTQNWDEIIDLEGRQVLPGFSDTHMHLLHYVLFQKNLALFGVDSIESIVRMGRERIVQNHPARLLGMGWNQEHLAEGRMPERRDLDRISTEIPICLLRVCAHIAACNTAMVERLTEIRDQVPPAVWEKVDVEHGLLREEAMRLYMEIIPPESDQEIRDMIRSGAADLNAAGITCVHSDDLQVLSGTSPAHLVELFRALERAGHRPRAAGIDISKYALRRAAKRLPEGEFAVASAYRLPLADASADLLTNVFSPLSAEEFARVLRPGGTFLYVVPSARHLWEMKQVLYSQPYENPVKETPYTGFSYQRIVPVRYEITLDCPEDIRALFQMTPYCWKTPREGVEALSALKRLTTQVGFDLHVFRRSPA
mgnify:CR=1 FL=1